MKIGTIVASAVALSAVGTAMYLYGNSTAKTKRKIKRTTEKAINSIGTAFEDISSLM